MIWHLKSTNFFNIEVARLHLYLVVQMDPTTINFHIRG
jgi:hypothetical protein